MTYGTKSVAHDPDVLAPDSSEIRLLLALPGAAHCSLPTGGVSRAVAHKTVREIWHFLGGAGEVWRRQGERKDVVKVSPGICLTIPIGTRFQFRHTGAGPLEFFIVTMPPWPGGEEAFRAGEYWTVH